MKSRSQNITKAPKNPKRTKRHETLDSKTSHPRIQRPGAAYAASCYSAILASGGRRASGKRARRGTAAKEASLRCVKSGHPCSDSMTNCSSQGTSRYSRRSQHKWQPWERGPVCPARRILGIRPLLSRESFKASQWTATACPFFEPANCILERLLLVVRAGFPFARTQVQDMRSP